MLETRRGGTEKRKHVYMQLETPPFGSHLVSSQMATGDYVGFGVITVCSISMKFYNSYVYANIPSSYLSQLFTCLHLRKGKV